MFDTDQDAFKIIRNHDEYYLSGGDLFFLVEQSRFRVHRYFFDRESSYFKKRLETHHGTSDATAIVLEDVTADDFARFLWIFYNPRYSLYDATLEDWEAILDLAHHWEFSEVKKLVVRELEKLEIPDVTRVALYHHYNIDRALLLHAYIALCTREQPLTLEEGECLGIETIVKIFQAREYARAPLSVNIGSDELQDYLKTMFLASQNYMNGVSDELLASPGTRPTSPNSVGKLGGLMSEPGSPSRNANPPKTNGRTFGNFGSLYGASNYRGALWKKNE